MSSKYLPGFMIQYTTEKREMQNLKILKVDEKKCGGTVEDLTGPAGVYLDAPWCPGLWSPRCTWRPAGSSSGCSSTGRCCRRALVETVGVSDNREAAALTASHGSSHCSQPLNTVLVQRSSYAVVGDLTQHKADKAPEHPVLWSSDDLMRITMNNQQI